MPMNLYRRNGTAKVEIRTDASDAFAEAVVMTNPTGSGLSCQVDFRHPESGTVHHGEAEPGQVVEIPIDPVLAWDSDNGDFAGANVNFSSVVL